MNISPPNCDLWLDLPAACLVADFQVAFGYEIRNTPFQTEDFKTDEFALLHGLIEEEFKELQEARDAGDRIGYIDALQDLKYVIYGLELRMGISSEEHFGEVHNKNMEKLGPDGKPIYREDGKVLKPEGWTGPDHESILADQEETGFLYG